MKVLSCILGWLAGIALIAAFPTRSLLGAIGFLAVWGFSLALLALFVRQVIRSPAPWGLRVAQGLVGGTVLVLGLFVVQRLRAPDEKAEIAAAIEAARTSTDPSVCRTEMTRGYREQLTGHGSPAAGALCEREVPANRGRSVRTSGIVVDGDSATALVADRGGSFDGSQFEVRLVRDGGRWMLDRVLAFRRFDRRRFDRAYQRSLLAFGSSPSSADCALARSQKLSDGEIEAASLGRGSVFARISVACDRAGTERSLVEAAADPEYDLPPAAIECVARRVRRLGDAELVRAQDDAVAYGEIVFDCGRGAIMRRFERQLRADEDLEPRQVACILGAYRNRGDAAAARLSYDQAAYRALFDRCTG